jgi:hypothetical protein
VSLHLVPPNLSSVQYGSTMPALSYTFVLTIAMKCIFLPHRGRLRANASTL